MNSRNHTVGEIVDGRPIYFVLESDTVQEAARYMTQYGIGAVPVLEERYRPGVFVDQVGILSERDLMTKVVSQGLDVAETKVRDVMTTKVAVLEPHNTWDEALAAMDELNVRHLPVLAGRQLLGTVSVTDLHESAANVREAELRFLDEYIDRMDDAAWGLIPVEEVCDRVVIQSQRSGSRA